ncbi:MAG: hypothetical protein Q9213_006605 [Squamulea squamosa]
MARRWVQEDISLSKAERIRLVEPLENVMTYVTPEPPIVHAIMNELPSTLSRG